MRTIEIIISPGGQSRLQTTGFVGNQCREASRLLEAALGKAQSESLTAEFHETPTQHRNHLTEGGASTGDA